ncbi:hypothetical protein JK628_03700 [Shewanella sp. KX20019]|nr:hypothetical protein [Shewanella sp. KX20019]QQX80987.1 hypothetical protein JK628_03700 [Shewanella sp. KX20019]
MMNSILYPVDRTSAHYRDLVVIDGVYEVEGLSLEAQAEIATQKGFGLL